MPVADGQRFLIGHLHAPEAASPITVRRQLGRRLEKA